MHITNGLMSSLLKSTVIHVVLISVFVFTFPNPKVSARPVFIFLGSFLRQQDVALSTMENLSQLGNINSRDLNLDMRRDSLPRAFDKPDLTDKIVQPARQQYKPVMNKDMGVSREQKTSDDFGIDLAPFTPVRMKMERNDQN